MTHGEPLKQSFELEGAWRWRCWGLGPQTYRRKQSLPGRFSECKDVEAIEVDALGLLSVVCTACGVFTSSVEYCEHQKP